MLTSTKVLTLVDIGCAGGLQDEWAPHVDVLAPVLIDANAAQALALQDRYPGAVVVPCGLAEADGPKTLFITRNHKCISVLEPNVELLAPYRSRAAFEVIGRDTVECRRYDSLHREGRVPVPDVVKADVQGYEHQVLSGFGDLLHDCLAVQIEAHVYPVYRGQRLLHDVTALLAGFGFVLRRLEPTPNFDGDMVEVDAFFTKRRDLTHQLSPARRAALALISDVWALPAR